MSVGSLNLINPIDLERGVSQLSVANTALHAVATQGFIFPGVPQNTSYRGMLPPNLVLLNNEQLGTLLQDVAGWCSWAQTELAKARQARNETEDKMEFTKSRLRLAIKAAHQQGKKPSNPEMDDIVRCDERYIEAQRNFRFTDAVYDYTRQLVEASQRDWDTVSRHITMRGQEVERSRRTDNVGAPSTPYVPVSSSAFKR